MAGCYHRPRVRAQLLFRRFVYLLAWGALIWAVVAASTGGVGWFVGPLRISSRQPLRPLLVGIAAAVLYVWTYSRAERSDDGRWLTGLVRRAAPMFAVAIVAAGLTVGISCGSFAAAGSDSYGYVSQARLWLEGTPRLEQPFVEQFSWPNREWVFAPLGYRPFSITGTIVPTYPPGLPLVMAGFLAVFGSDGPFIVVPVFAAFALWFTYLLGRHVTGSSTAAAGAALILLASPVFLTHVMLPMSDVPAAAGWTLVSLLALKQRPLAAGLVAGATLLIRPNLVLLAAAPIAAWRHPSFAMLKHYALGLAPGLATVAVLNTFLYGSPLTSGYGPLLDGYEWRAAWPNVRNYAAWLLKTETPLVALAALPLLRAEVLRDSHPNIAARRTLGALLALTLVSYAFYGVFNHWFYLRFLLPALPALFVLWAAAVRFICLKLPHEARVPAAAVLCAVVVLAGIKTGREEGIFRQREYEQRHIRAAELVAASTPPAAAIIALQHSGSVRYYADRITLRYDWLSEKHLDAAIRDLQQKGYHPFAVVDDWEENDIRNRFGAHNRAGRLDWPPLARVKGNPEVRVYDLQGRAE